MTASVDTAAFRLAPSPAEQLLRDGQPEAALQALVAQVRQAPADASARLFLCQLFAACGQWTRARDQLDVAMRLDSGNALLCATWQALIDAEAARTAVFAGEALPTVIGAPADWLAAVLEALRLDGRGEHAAAAALRSHAFEAAPAVSGQIDGQAFAWLADADPRFGPCLELVLQGGYGWVPFERIARLAFDAPASLADTLWAPVEVTWRNGGQAHGYVPVRYPGSEHLDEPGLRLGRATGWTALADDTWAGQGQRMFTTDAGDHPLLEIRVVTFDAADAG
ncbi:type VI secretion system accessory protein TagJ [Luteimonas deserti]|uniref:Tetratricopeptide repeat protein n=1 Tax=Luteimonas deserti TaxID=2752306 RepID=A0A7Z0U1F7_9GAMM|nr:type VI secretion system accessory protein TagJ [Luteimonas deserti]NYZ64283.1 tetratricopeptide repeat protein [Luteimonas deserti]